MKKVYVQVYAGVIVALFFVLQGSAVMGAEKKPKKQKTTSINLQKLNERYRNALVRVEITTFQNMSETILNPEEKEEYGGSAHGTGFFISENEILTNAHVVYEAKQGSIRIKSPATGNAEFKMELIGMGNSGGIDLAVIKFAKGELERFHIRSELGKIPTLKFGDSSSVKQSDPLAIMGFPLESDELKVIEAEVTGRQYHEREFGNLYIRHQFIEVGPGGTVQPGNSGGPALNARGQIVGIPTLGNHRGSQGWLIPSNIVTAFIGRIKETRLGKKQMPIPEVGVVLEKNFTGKSVWAGAPEDVTLFELGVVIKEVLDQGQATEFGLKAGDIIVGFANEQKKISCALDFEGYRVVTGKMAKWPNGSRFGTNADKFKLHLEELFFVSEPGDDVTLWYIRNDSSKTSLTKTALSKVTKKIEIKNKSALPRLGIYEKPDYARWADVVVQEFNQYNANYFDLSLEEQEKGGLIITHVARNSIASKRGIRSARYCRYRCYDWFVVDAVNGKKIKTLDEFRAAIAEATKLFEGLVNSQNLNTSEQMLLRERYVQFSIRTENSEGEIVVMKPVLPIDDASKVAFNMDKKQAIIPVLPIANPDAAVASVTLPTKH